MLTEKEKNDKFQNTGRIFKESYNKQEYLHGIVEWKKNRIVYKLWNRERDIHCFKLHIFKELQGACEIKEKYLPVREHSIF